MNVNNKKINKKRTTLYFIKVNNKILTTELSPFPGISEDTLESLEFRFENALKGNYTPNLNSHVDFALFELSFKESWKEVFSPQTIKSNKLISYTQVADFSALAKYQTLKIKIDNNINNVKSYLTSNIENLKKFKLRLDSNARLTLAQLKILYQFIIDNKLTLDYFEEPLINIKDYKTCNVPFALDENIRFYRNFPNVHTLILKPTQFYSKDLWENVTKNKPIVISSTFDSIFTHATLLAMAQTLKQKENTHGLDNNNYNGLGFELELEDVFPTISEKHYNKIISKS
jgi:O-succinylbenzoate synthase